MNRAAARGVFGDVLIPPNRAGCAPGLSLPGYVRPAVSFNPAAYMRTPRAPATLGASTGRWPGPRLAGAIATTSVPAAVGSGGGATMATR